MSGMKDPIDTQDEKVSRIFFDVLLAQENMDHKFRTYSGAKIRFSGRYPCLYKSKPSIEEIKIVCHAFEDYMQAKQEHDKLYRNYLAESWKMSQIADYDADLLKGGL